MTGTETVFTIVAAVAVASVAVLVASFVDAPMPNPLPALLTLTATAAASMVAFEWAGRLGRRVHHNRNTKGDNHS